MRHLEVSFIVDPVLSGDEVKSTAQTYQDMLSAEGANRRHIVKTTVFLKNFADFERMNATYQAFFGDHKPARTTVEVSRLPKDALVEIECVAEVG